MSDKQFKIFFFILSFLSGLAAWNGGLGTCTAQDIHFSQFYNSPLTLNPANTGNYHGDWRFANILRRQWTQIVNKKNFQTIGLSYDQQIYIFSERISIGFLGVNDRSGQFLLQQNSLYLSAAYHKTISGNNFHFGLQGGLAMKSFDNAKAGFPDNYFQDNEKAGFTPGASGTNFEKKKYPDFNTGIIWNRKFGKFEPEAGFALYHFNSPNESLIKNDNGRLPMRQVFHFGGKIILTEKIFIMPNILIMHHKKAKDYLEGANLAYRLPKNAMAIHYVYGGVLFRNGIQRNNDAVIAIIGTQFSKLNVGLSYDVNVSDLRAGTKYRGGFEVSIIYIGPSTLLQHVAIPCDRD